MRHRPYKLANVVHLHDIVANKDFPEYRGYVIDTNPDHGIVTVRWTSPAPLAGYETTACEDKLVVILATDDGYTPRGEPATLGLSGSMEIPDPANPYKGAPWVKA